VFITLDETPYEIYDEPSSILLDCADVMSAMVDNTIVVGGDGAPSTFISGAFKLDRVDAAPLLAVLPSFLLLPAGEERSGAFEAILGMLARETSRREIGSEAMIGRLFEVLFIHAVRAYCEHQASPATGWLAVVVDPQLGQVARAMHDNLGKDWTLEALATIAGMSRSAFAARFKERAGKTALEYLTYWRMHEAARRIRLGNRSLAQIARDVGYQSEAAFNRMFAREIGITPGRYGKSPELAT
jgi:AraC-like DNA-binding protein